MRLRVVHDMIYDPHLHLKRHADDMARDAAANAPDGTWCRHCGTHRTTSPAVLCPVCSDEGDT